MDSPSSPIVLYLGDDDDDDEQNQPFDSNMLLPRASTSNDMNASCKKRKLTNTNVCVNPSITNQSKRYRNDQNQQRSSHNFIDPDPDPEPILLDPDEYIIEELDPQSFRAFDWTIEPKPPPPPSLLSPKKPSNPVPSISKVSTIPPYNAAKRPVDKPATISAIPNKNQKDNFIQQQGKLVHIPAPRPSLALLSLPLPKPAASLIRQTSQRGRPAKNSRVQYTQTTSPPSPVRQRTEQQNFPRTQPISRPPPSLPPPPAPAPASRTVTTSSTSEIRRQALNGTGIFSAFHDSNCYRCNICKFKSTTSSTLLQHLFTHMFFCHQCPFYTYSHYNLTQHVYEKHNLKIIEELNDPLNPKSFDLLYITRCADGTFALCMDSTSSPSSSSSSTTTTTTTTLTTNKIDTNNTDQRLLIPSVAADDQHHQVISEATQIVKQNDLSKENDKDVVLMSEKYKTNNRSLIHSPEKGKQNETFVLMKHRRCYSMKKSRCLHSLTLEYNICREHTIRHLCHTQGILKPRKFLTKFNTTVITDEVVNCLRTIVNQVVDNEDNSFQSSLICTLPNHLLNPIISDDNLTNLTNSLKLSNRYERYNEQSDLYESERILRQSHEYTYVLSAPEINHNEQTIISSLHSPMTNGDSFFTQTKLNKLPISYDNTHKFLKGNLNIQPRMNNSNPKVQKKNNTIQSPPKSVPLRPVVSKPVRSLSNISLPTTIDKNNNSITSPQSKLPKTTSPSFIILD